MNHRIQPSTLMSACLLLASFLATGSLRSETVYQTQAAGFVASAQFLEGDDESKVVLILHGFLQTKDFFTVRRLGEALHDQGYTLLMPNLTLGIDKRRQSLACEAIHTHSLDQDVSEIDSWVQWLHRKTGKPVTLIGHSAGSLELLVHLAGNPASPVDQAILISLVPFLQGPIAKESEMDRQLALRHLADERERENIHNYRLAFCDTYPTTPNNYLSYLKWNSNKTLETLNKSVIKPTVLLGGEDRRLGDDWLPALQGAGTEVIQIPGANHFFDHEHEFDLMDTVTQLLEATTERAR